MRRQRQYRVTAEGLLGRYDAGLIRANTRRSAVRRAIRRYVELAQLNGWGKEPQDFHWSAEFERDEAQATP